MLIKVLALVALVGLTSAALLTCFEKWGWLRAWQVRGPRWLPYCLFCAGYWLSVLLLAIVLSVAMVLLPDPYWPVVVLALPLGLPAAAVCSKFF